MKKSSETSQPTTHSTGDSTTPQPPVQRVFKKSRTHGVGARMLRWSVEEIALLADPKIRMEVFTKANMALAYRQGIKTPQTMAAHNFFKKGWPTRTPDAVRLRAYKIHHQK